MRTSITPLLLVCVISIMTCCDSGKKSQNRTYDCESYMVDCRVYGKVEDDSFKEVKLFRAGQSWIREKPVASFEVKQGRFSGTVRMDTTLVYELVFMLQNAGMAKYRPFIPSETGIQVCCPKEMDDAILLQSSSLENENLIGYEDIRKSLESVAAPIYQKYEQLMGEEKYYSDEVYALIAEARSSSRERATEIWDQLPKLRKLDDSYSDEGLAVKKELDAYNALCDSLCCAYLIEHLMLSSLYEVWQGVEISRQQGKDIKPWLDTYDSYYAELFPDHPYHEKILGLVGNNVGEKIRDFTLPDEDGVQRQLSELIAGKIALVDFWASWCGTCRIRSKTLKPLFEKYAGDDFTIVGVANEYGDDTKWRKALKRDNYPWINLIASDAGAAFMSNHAKVFLIDRKGTILSINPTIDEIEAIIQASQTANLSRK